jgi:histidinol-phosphate phosphatase family protein
MTRAVFLDRDGTLIQERNYLRQIEQVEFIPGAGKALAKLKIHGFLLILLTNQSGVGRGFFTMEDVQRVHRHILAVLQRDGATLDGIYICPHQPEDNCNCRKPKTKLLEDAAEKFAIDLPLSFVIGDKAIDVELARRAGCGAVLVRTGYGEKALSEHKAAPDYVATDLPAAVEWVLKESVSKVSPNQ